MNTGILQKCLDELSKEAPRLDYVRGILETLIESQPAERPPLAPRIPLMPAPVDDIPPTPDLNKIKAIAASSMYE